MNVGVRFPNPRPITIRKLRRDADMSQGQLAERLGVNLMTVNRWERGHQIPSGDTLQKIARLFGVDARLIVLDPDSIEGNPSGPVTDSHMEPQE